MSSVSLCIHSDASQAAHLGRLVSRTVHYVTSNDTIVDIVGSLSAADRGGLSSGLESEVGGQRSRGRGSGSGPGGTEEKKSACSCKLQRLQD